MRPRRRSWPAPRTLALAALLIALVPAGSARSSGVTVSVVLTGSASAHTCAVTSDGGLKCWGNNDSGQLGDGTMTDRSVPVDVVGLGSGVLSVATGHSHTCALTSGGALKCWGRGSEGQLGDGGACGLACPTPVAVSGFSSGAASVVAGYAHTCALTTSGGAKCWGNSFHGQVGNGQVGDTFTTPVDVVTLGAGVAALSAGDWHGCAVTTSGGAKCWGENLHGQLGDGTSGGNRVVPTDVSGLTSGVSALAAGERHTCALTTGGGVKCWGRNDFGQLGDGTTGGIHSTFVDVLGLDAGVNAIAAGSRHTCAVVDGGSAQCWGKNQSGQLGDGTTALRPTPGSVVGLGAATALSAGAEHGCGLTASAGVRCWGANADGRLGDGSLSQQLTPADVAGLAPKDVGGIAELPPAGRKEPEGAVGAPLAAAAAAGLLLGGAWLARRRAGRP